MEGCCLALSSWYLFILACIKKCWLRNSKNRAEDVFLNVQQKELSKWDLCFVWTHLKNVDEPVGVCVYKRWTTREYYFFAAVNRSCRDNLLVFLTSWGRSCQFFLAGLFSSYISPRSLFRFPLDGLSKPGGLIEIIPKRTVGNLETSVAHRKASRKMVMKPQSRGLTWIPYKY